MAFYYILIGHLLGDFVLQTNRIAVNKPIYRKWGIIHAVIVTMCMLIFALPFGLVTTFLVIAAGFFHLLVDRMKSALSEKYNVPQLPSFIADQLLHIAAVAFASCCAPEKPLYIIFNWNQLSFVLILLFVTFFAAIFNQYILIIFFPRPGNVLFEKGEKLFGILTRFILTLTAYVSFKASFLYLFLLLAIPALKLLQVRLNGKSTGSRKECLVRFVLDVVFSSAGAGVLFLTVN